MLGPAAARLRPPVAPLRGFPWFAARLSLAVARTRRFTRWWSGVGGAVVAVALLVPAVGRDRGADSAVALEQAAVDSLRTAGRLRQLRALSQNADTALAEALAASERVPVRRRARSTTDPSVRSLARALARADSTRSAASYLALADEPLVRYGPRMRAFADSLARTQDAREVRRLGLTIAQMAQYRLAALEEGPVREDRVVAETPPDTAALRALSVALADSVRRASARHADRVADVARLDSTARAMREAVPALSMGPLLLLILLLGLFVRVGTALLQELGAPTLAHSVEAERAVGAPALALVRDPLPEGPLRFRPSGVDPFRVLYLALTSTGTRARSVIVTGREPLIAAAAGARLAIAAAADHRTTLVVDLDPEQIALARIFRDHPEPGFTDALAQAFQWREVARAVGSSDGLALQMLPAGTARDPVPDAPRAEACASFRAFREAFELTIVVAALSDLALARELLPGAPVVLSATIGETPIDQFVGDARDTERSGERLHSLALWDAPRPQLPSRAELAAHLSKRKGRTPGGSFKAVQEAINKPSQS